MFFIIRILTFVPLLIITISMGQILAKKWNIENRFHRTRVTIFTITVALLANNAVYLTSDIFGLLFNQKQAFLQQNQPIILIVQLLILYAVWRFYKLFYSGGK